MYVESVPSRLKMLIWFFFFARHVIMLETINDVGELTDRSVMKLTRSKPPHYELYWLWFERR
jgi:mRNA degradation ribonuclease J1/J2